MKKEYFLFIFLIILSNLYSQNNTNNIQDELKNIKNDINEINKDLSDYKNNNKLVDFLTDVKIKNLEELINKHYANISNQIAFSSYVLGIFTLIITIIGIVLGFYINTMWKKIKNISESIEECYKKNNKMYINTKILNDQINNNIDDLYQKLKESETEFIFKRLNECPEDIQHYFGYLATRKLSEKYFKSLVNLFLKNVEQSDYLTLLFQHFFELILFDSVIYKNLENNYLNIFDCSYTSEIINNIKLFYNIYKKMGFKKISKKIYKFINFLLYSNHGLEKEIYITIFKLLNKNEHFYFYILLKRIINSKPGRIYNGNRQKTIEHLELYSSLLYEKYNLSENKFTGNEEEILKEIKQSQSKSS